MTLNMSTHDLTRTKRKELVDMITKKAAEQNLIVSISHVDIEMHVVNAEIEVGKRVIKLKM